MAKWFKKQSRLLQIILLLIPVVNWIVEIGVRWSAYFDKKNNLTLIAAILVTFFGAFIGWLDIIWCLLFKRLTFTK